MCVWDLEGGKKENIFLSSVCAEREREYLISLGENGLICVWDDGFRVCV